MQELRAHEFDLAYFKDRRLGELDFMVQTGGKVVPIEVKSGKPYKRHSALTKALSTPNYGIERAVFADMSYINEKYVHFAAKYLDG